MTNAREVDCRLRRSERLGGRKAFQAVFDAGLRAAGPQLVLFGCANNLAHSRFGISIGRRYGSAVRRNRFKRVCREAFRLCKSERPAGFDWVVVPNLGPRGKPHTKREMPLSPLRVPRLAATKSELLELMGRIARRHANGKGSS